MSVQAKICGLNNAASVVAASENGARYAGFVFYPKSPRAVSAETAASLIKLLPASVTPVGLFVDPSDDDIADILKTVPLKAIQLHGNETPSRVAQVKNKTGLIIIKAIGVASAKDIDIAHSYESVADMLLLDAKPTSDDLLPGGNAQTFDWSLLKNAQFAKPWMLAGGLTAANVATAVAATGARMVDVSSGVEDAPGHKNPMKIKDFLAAVQQIETSC